MATEPSELLAAIEAQFLGASGACQRIVETPGFRVHLWTAADAFYRNGAVPIVRPPDWEPAIAAMAAAFDVGWRRPALEYLEERWPDLGRALAAAGFAREARLTVMVSDGRGAATRSAGEAALAWGSVCHVAAATPEPALRAYLEALHRSFAQHGAAGVGDADVTSLARALADGRCQIAMIKDEAGSGVAGANLIGIGQVPGVRGPVAELSGVWAAEPARGRGLARTVSAALLARFFADGGGLVWLAAENARVAGLYARLGFRQVGHLLRYSRCPLEDHGAAQHP
jgi:ribosomal protein S18 acetylase RimI-like enzyme